MFVVVPRFRTSSFALGLLAAAVCAPAAVAAPGSGTTSAVPRTVAPDRAVTTTPRTGATGTTRAADLARCAEPAGHDEQARRDPAELGLDPVTLRRGVRAAVERAGGSVAVYRYGCLAASDDSEGPMRGYQSWSASKSVVSMAVARAIRLGLLSMDDTVGALIPEADAEHGAITVRNLLQQNSGLHQHLIRDYNFILDDHLQNALTLPFDHPRGTHFTYGQVTVSLLAEVVGRAAGMDYQRFLREQLFAPLGIPGDVATIKRDRAGRTDAYMGIEMPPRFWGRLGRLLLQDGRWGDRRLLDQDWMAQVGRGTATNACYSLLFWPDAPGCAPRWAPADGYEMNGLGEQIVWVVPSQSLVVVRFGTMTSGVKDALKEAVTAAIVRPAKVPQRAPEAETGEPSVDPDAAFRTILDLRDVLAVVGVRLEPLPPAGPPRARALQLPADAMRAAPDGALEVPVACPPVARVPCAGELEVAPDGAGERAIATANYRVARGARGVVRLATPAVARLAATGPARIVLRSRTTDPAGGVPGSRVVTVEPATRPGLRLTAVRLRAGEIRVRTSARATATVRVQRREGRRWRTVRTATLRGTGTLRARLRALPAGRYRVLVRARAESGAAASRRATMVVR